MKVTLQCPSAQKGDAVLVSSLDGGEITAPAGILRVAPDGTVFFHFRAPGLPGNYRVLVQFAGQEQVLNFYVLDTEHPNNNPPRVKIVD